MIRRREFITLLGGAAAMWPLAARAQQPESVRRIGVLSGAAKDTPDLQARLAAFQKVLQQLGWTDGRNVRIDYRWGAGSADNIRRYAAELVALAPDVILATGPTVEQVLQATRSVPIVFVITADPVGSGADMDLRHVVVSLRLPPELALRRLVDLPAAAEENLRQVLAFEMDRLTPFASDAVHYDVRVIDRNLENRRIRVELMVLPRAAVDPAVRLLHRLGLEPETVVLPRGADERAPWRLPLAGNGSGERRLVGRASVALLALAGVLLVAAVYTAFDRQRARAERLGREVEMARKEAEEGRLLQEQIEQLSAEGTFIIDKKRARPPVVQVLNELTQALPDDTWLYRLRFINEELQTFGYSPNASAMIGHIENSALFSNAQFRAPLTRDQRAEAEQFHIAFQVAKKKAP